MKHIYRVYAEEKVVKTFEQDVIAESKKEAIKLAQNNKDNWAWTESDDIGEGTFGLVTDEAFARVVMSDEDSTLRYELENSDY